MASPLALLSLNQDVLSEILSFLLLDTPRELNRTSILRTCSSLQLLGLPQLYRIVDLTGFEEDAVVTRHWITLFGEKGVLTVEGRDLTVGRFVRELKLGGGTAEDEDRKHRKKSFDVPGFNLPACTSLLLDFPHLSFDNFPSLPSILSQLVVTKLWLRYEDYHGIKSPPVLDTFGYSPMDLISPNDQLWRRHLDVLTVQGWLWYDELYSTDEDFLGGKLSFSDLSIRVLVFRANPNGKPRFGDEPDEEGVDVVELFLNVKWEDQEAFLPRTERIEFRGGPVFIEKEFRRVVVKREEVGLSEFEKRIASMIVFLDEDGTERRLLEEVET